MTTEYRVVARIPTSDNGGYKEVTSDWDYRKDWTLPIAERLEEIDGATVEVHTREVDYHADLSEVPN